jgi:MFS family permease
MARSRIAGWFEGYRSALAHRDLRLLLGGLVISATGSWAYNVGLLAFVFDRTGSLGWVGAAGLVRYIPSLLLSPYGGVVAERSERVRLMVGADVLCAVWMGLLFVVAAVHGPVVVALVFAFLSSATSVVYNPAVAATIPSVVGEDDLVAANALNGTIDNLVVVVGPAIGAVVLLVGSANAVFAVDAVSFAVSAALVARIRIRSQPIDVTAEGGAGVLGQITVGARTIMKLRAARTLVAYCALVSFAYGTDTVLFVGVSEHKLGTGSHGFGYLLAGLGVGGILMAPAIDKLSGSRRLATIILVGTLGYCLPTALLIWVHSPAVAFAIQVERGAATLVVDVLAITALQRAVPSEQLARVFGVFFAFVIGAVALGTVLTPAVVSATSLNGGLLVMALAPSLLGALGYPALLSIDRAGAARADALAPTVAVLEQLEVFATASRPLLERLASAASEVTFEPGTVIIREGDPADALYVLVGGSVRVTAVGGGGGVDGGGGVERELRTMTAPSYFGEIGVLEQIPRTATVTTLAECQCLQLDGEAWLDALTTAPPSSSLMEVASSRLALTHPGRELTFPRS